jgi:hypothetical protein
MVETRRGRIAAAYKLMLIGIQEMDPSCSSWGAIL